MLQGYGNTGNSNTGNGGNNAQNSNQNTPNSNQNNPPSNALVPAGGGQPADDEPNMIGCDMCGKMVRETSLAAHKKRHELAEKRPFKCEICQKVNLYFFKLERFF